MILTEDKKEELKGKFQSIFECEKKIESLNEQIKEFNSSIKDTFESIAESMEIDPKDKEGKKGIKDGYKDYIKSITNPSGTETQNEVFLILKDNDFLGLEKLSDE